MTVRLGLLVKAIVPIALLIPVRVDAQPTEFRLRAPSDTFAALSSSQLDAQPTEFRLRAPSDNFAALSSSQLERSVEPSLRARLETDQVLAGRVVAELERNPELRPPWLRLEPGDTVSVPNAGWYPMWTSVGEHGDRAPFISDSLLRESLSERFPGEVSHWSTLPAASELLKSVATRLEASTLEQLSELEQAVLATGPKFGSLQAFAPPRVEPGSEFSIDLLAQPADTISKNLPDSVRVRLEQTPNIQYSSPIVYVKPTEERRVDAVAKRRALIPIIATAPEWEPLYSGIDAGFDGQFEPTIRDELSSGSPQSFVVNVLDGHGRSLRIDVPVTLTVQVTGARIRRVSHPWSENENDSLEIALNRGATESPMLQIEPNKPLGGEVSIQTKAKVPWLEEWELRGSMMRFEVETTWWIKLIAALCGGLLSSCYFWWQAEKHKEGTKEEREEPKTPWRRLLLSGAGAGTLAFLVAEFRVMDIGIEATNAFAYVLIGILVGYVGVDQTLDRFLSA